MGLRVDQANGPTRCRVFRAVAFVVDPFAVSRVSGASRVEGAVGTLEDVDEAGSGGRRRCLALRLLLDSPGTGCSLGVAQGHSPWAQKTGGPKCGAASSSRVACHERALRPASGPACESSGGSAWESNPAPPQSGERPVLKTGRATGPRSLPVGLYHQRPGRHTPAIDGEPRFQMCGMRVNDTAACGPNRPGGLQVDPAPKVLAGAGTQNWR